VVSRYLQRMSSIISITFKLVYTHEQPVGFNLKMVSPSRYSWTTILWDCGCPDNHRYILNLMWPSLSKIRQESKVQKEWPPTISETPTSTLNVPSCYNDFIYFKSVVIFNCHKKSAYKYKLLNVHVKSQPLPSLLRN